MRESPDKILITANKMPNPFWKEALTTLSQVSNVFMVQKDQQINF